MRMTAAVLAGIIGISVVSHLPAWAAPSPTGKPSRSARPPAPPPVACDPPQAALKVTGVSWAHKRLGLERVWALTKGRGVTVAVVDSGVEADHPMLSGRIAKAIDLTGTDERDCQGHGTGVAAIIGGRDLSGRGIALSGVAPDVRLLVVKNQNEQSDQAGGDRLPQSIRAAVDGGADVINVSIRTGPSPALAEAVRYALDNDVVIVAGAGNASGKTGELGPAFPASSPGVLSVGSLGPDGARLDTSSQLTRVDVGAPGRGIQTAWTRGSYMLQGEGTSFAAAYVSGVAALVRAYHPRLTQQQVVHRIVATADGTVGAGSGRGMVNAMQAVSAVLPEEGADTATAPRPPAPVSLAAPATDDDRARRISLAVTGGTVGLAALAVVAGVVAPMGRRRRWRAGRVTSVGPPPDPVDEDLGPLDRARIG